MDFQSWSLGGVTLGSQWHHVSDVRTRVVHTQLKGTSALPHLHLGEGLCKRRKPSGLGLSVGHRTPFLSGMPAEGGEVVLGFLSDLAALTDWVTAMFLSTCQMRGASISLKLKCQCVLTFLVHNARQSLSPASPGG
jgi:hypothetical protein